MTQFPAAQYPYAQPPYQPFSTMVNQQPMPPMQPAQAAQYGMPGVAPGMVPAPMPSPSYSQPSTETPGSTSGAAAPAPNVMQQWFTQNGINPDDFKTPEAQIELLNGLREQASKSLQMQERLSAQAAAAQQPAPQQQEQDWRQYRDYLTKDDTGKIVPKDQYSPVPHWAIEQANAEEIRFNNDIEALRKDPVAWLDSTYGQKMEERIAQLADERFKAQMAERDQTQKIESFLKENAGILFARDQQGNLLDGTNGRPRQLSPDGQKFSDLSGELAARGVQDAHLLEETIDRWKLAKIHEQIEVERQQAEVAQQQAAYQQAMPQQQPQQPATESTQFNQFAQPQPQQPIPQQQIPSAPQQEYPGFPGYQPQAAPQQFEQPQFQTPQTAHMPQGQAPQPQLNPSPAIFQSDSAVPQTMPPGPEQQTFMQSAGVSPAAFEPEHRPHADAGSAIGSPANDQHLPDIEDIAEQQILAAGLN